MKSLKKAVFAAVLFWIITGCVTVKAETESVKVGQSVDMSKEDASYASRNPEIAVVSKDGCVTGKRKGKTKIVIVKNGKVSEKNIKVVSNGRKPSLKICADEVLITKSEVISAEPKNGLTDKESGDVQIPQKSSYLVRLHIKNISSSDAKSVLITGRIAGKKIKLKYEDFFPGEKAVLEEQIETESINPEFELISVRVRSKGMYHTRNYETDTMDYSYATEDDTPPEITGFIGKDSYNGNIPYQTVYTDTADDYDFFKYVKATDDRDEKVNISVDTSEVNFEKKGTYTITYCAEDKAGNVTEEKAKIAVRVNDQYDDMADKILARITKKKWSDKKKAVAIYNYVRGHLHYAKGGSHKDWELAAKRGIRYGRGDCFVYFSLARLLLSRAGIPNLKVVRVKGVGEHWWNMAYVEGGFYHYDCCPRVSGGRFCLVTDAQLKYYSSHRGHNSHIWAYDKKPKTPKKKISSI